MLSGVEIVNPRAVLPCDYYSFNWSIEEESLFYLKTKFLCNPYKSQITEQPSLNNHWRITIKPTPCFRSSVLDKLKDCELTRIIFLSFPLSTPWGSPGIPVPCWSLVVHNVAHVVTIYPIIPNCESANTIQLKSYHPHHTMAHSVDVALSLFRR